jgi:hypothetical protein
MVIPFFFVSSALYCAHLCHILRVCVDMAMNAVVMYPLGEVILHLLFVKGRGGGENLGRVEEGGTDESELLGEEKGRPERHKEKKKEKQLAMAFLSVRL